MKHVSILVPEGDLSLIDIVGAWKAFKRVNQYLVANGKEALFDVQLVGIGPCRSLEGGLFTVHPQVRLGDVDKTDLVMIPAASWNFKASLDANAELIPWIVQQYNKGAEVASMCIGGVLLASTGLLNGRSCSTHWMAANRFRQLFPEINLVVDKLITDEQGIYTSGGAFSFVNLLLYLIEKYCDRETAIYCAKVFEVDIDRNNQAAYIMFAGLKDHQDKEIREAQSFIENNIAEKISFDELAARVGIGRRNFDRRFVKATFNTPLEYWQRVKMEAAKKMLESTRMTVQEVMYEVGYSDLRAFRKVFRRFTLLSPIDYRNRYNKSVVKEG